MAEIRPFKALRFTEKAGKIETLTCPPYDIISEERRLSYLSENPHNIIRLELPREEQDGKNQYEVAGEVLKSWLADGILTEDNNSALYVYEIEFEIDERHELSGVTAGKRSIIGLVGLLKLEEFEKGIVIPHEETLSKAKADRLNLMKATYCNFSNIYTLYKNDDKNPALNLEKLISGKAPLTEMTDEAGLVHRIWAISDPAAIEAIEAALLPKEFYIADGHHRYETALNFSSLNASSPADSSGCESGGQEGIRKTDYIMNMMVDMSHPGLVVFPTHRLLHSIEGFSESTVLEKCGEYFEIEKNVPLASLEAELTSRYLGGKHSFALYTGAETVTLLTLKDMSVMDKFLPDKSTASKSLDVAILHAVILEGILGIDREDLANQKNLTYTRSLPEAIEGIRSGAYQCSFILNPTRVSEISDVAAAGEKMPQKSTYFYPKLITGLTMNKLN